MIAANAERTALVVDAYESYLLVLSAMRYALGRRTYIVGEAETWVRAVVPIWTAAMIKTAIRDIREQERFGYGDDCDRRVWLGLLAWLEEQLQQREAAEGVTL